jgi:LysM repeat protein
MKNSNPFVPQGSILEQQNKRRSRLKLAVFCVLTVSVVGLSVMLIQGCKREQPVDTDVTTPTIDTNLMTSVDTNPPVADTNPPVVEPPVAVAPTVVVPPPPPAPTTADYVVIKGDTLDKIAKKNHVTVKALQAANPGVVPTKLKVGQKLVVPGGISATSAAPDVAVVSSASGTYVVKSGDSLMKIAKAHGTTVKAIQAQNNLATTRINVGQKLKIPTKATAASSAPVPEPMSAVPAPTMPVMTPTPEPAK